MKRLLQALCSCAVCLPSLARCAPEEVQDANLGFTLRVPDGFKPEKDAVKGKVIHSFSRPPRDDQSMGTMVLVQRMGGVIGRGPIDRKTKAADGGDLQFSTAKWKEFEIEVVRMQEKLEGVPCISLKANVPLKPEAILLIVFGETSREAELRGLLDEMLATLDGDTNWLTGSERGEQWGRVVGGILVGVIAVLIVRLVRKRSIKRES